MVPLHQPDNFSRTFIIFFRTMLQTLLALLKFDVVFVYITPQDMIRLKLKMINLGHVYLNKMLYLSVCSAYE